MSDDIFDELKTLWPFLSKVRTRLASNTFRRLSFKRQQRNSESSTSTSSTDIADSTMQPCWPTCEPEASVDRSNVFNDLSPCEYCFAPSSPVIMTDMFNSSRTRLSSQPVSVPDSPTNTELTNSHPQPQGQSQSSGYASGFGNGLSPTTNSWTLGVNNFSLCQSVSSNDAPSEYEQFIFDDSSTTDEPDDEVPSIVGDDFNSRHNHDDDDDDDDSFEVLSFEAPPESSLYFKEFEHTTPDEQNHVCTCCSVPFHSLKDSRSRRCYYYGKLYCSRCHINDYAYIPAKVINSFDMRLYPVSRRAKSILQLNYYQGIFDIQHDNESLYNSVAILNELRTLRSQFQHCYRYLSTCTRIEKETYEKLLEDFRTRDYLYQSIHSYSISDLLSLKKLCSIMEKALHRAKKHIRSCLICREKGFICEICKNRRDILYPFDDSKLIGQCSQCSNLYHRFCWDSIDRDCPRCYRIYQRKHQQEQN